MSTCESFISWTDTEWNFLVRSIKTKKCILMLGPDASLVHEGEEYRSLSRKLADRLVRNFKDKADYKKIDLKDLTQAAMYHCIEEKVHRYHLKQRASDYFAEKCKKASLTDHYLNLAGLPFYFIVSSTPDKMFVEALRAKKKIPIVASYDFSGTRDDEVQIERASDKTPLVYFLYGVSDDPDSLVLTEEDLLDYIVKIVSGDPPIPDSIIKEVKNEQQSLLFLGFGLKHWYFRILLHVLRGKSKEGYSIAFEDLVRSKSEELEKTVLFYRKSNYNIEICSDDICAFVKELKQRFENSKNAQSGEDETEAKYLFETQEETPSVFICHASEDAEFARKVSNELKDAGLKPLLDEEILEPGDNWNLVLEEKIHDCQYFVVLLSKALSAEATADMRYVNKEINWALERQKEISPFGKLRFIIPAKIEQRDQMRDIQIRDIRHIQSIDLSDKKNFEKLVETIKKDYQRRFKRKKQLNQEVIYG